ncbi:MAG: hypothetical protein A3F17_05540 [Gammaproteobacteria bacterium RIFCSPHIGHO2_12_FULL_41_15]|nr:MAG: hypothetical protein A3F17_05540 [Gammaproteobacteria bacterium RIFCSPHIGHO2_12_FULL_41_15]
MRTVAKIGISLITAILALLLIGYLLIHTFINPKRYQEQIKHMFYAKTQQHLQIKGDMLLHFFPWVGLSMTNVLISNPPPIQVQPFAEIGNIELQLNILALLRGEFDLDKISLNNLTVNFIRQSDEENNHTTVANLLPIETHQAAQTIMLSTSQAQHIQAIKDKEEEQENIKHYIDIDQLNINHATLNWLDQKTGKMIRLKNFNLMATNLSANKSGTLQANFNIESNEPLTAAEMPFSNNKLRSEISGSFLLNKNTNIPTYNTVLFIKQLDIAPLINLYQEKKNFQLTGLLTGKINAKSSGDSMNAIKQNLVAHSTLALDNGTLTGLNLDQLIQQINILKNIPTLQTKPLNTSLRYNKITGSFNIENEKLNNSDLRIIGNDISGSGHGTLNLSNHMLNYELTLQMAQSILPLNIPITLNVTGPINAPNTTIHIASIGTKILERDFLKQLGKQFKNKP